MMNEFASSQTRGCSDPGRAVTGARRGGFLFLLVSLLVALAAVGCSGGEDPREDTHVTSGNADEDANGGDEGPGEDVNVVIMFPKHDAPLGTDNGGHYFAGQLALDEGCLRAEVPEDPNTPASSWLLIWPSAFTLDTEDGALRIVDENGRIAARVGDHIRLSRATVSYQEAQDQGLIQGLSEECAGPYVLVGDEVTAFDPNNEPTELRLSDPDLIFPRQTTTIGSVRELLTAAGFGELALNGHCLGLKDGETIIWPAGFTPHVDQGVVQVRNGAGRTIAKVGDRIASGGGFSSSGYGDCPGGRFGIHSIKVLPDVEVYFPKQDGTLGIDQEMEHFVGKLVVERRCLMVDAAIRVKDRVIMPGGRYLLIWPDTFSLSMNDKDAGIVDATGRVVASVGDEIQFSAVSVSYQEAMDHSGLREITPACSGPYWVVGDDIAAGLLSNDQQGPHSEHSAMQPTAPPSSDVEDDDRSRDFPPAPVWGPDAVYSEKDLEKAIQRVHYAIYCSQWTMDATTSADGGMILSLVAIGGPANGEVMSIEGFQSTAEHALLSGANEGISVMVEEWDGPVSTPESREKACDDYVHSRTQEELQEADLRFYARQEGLSYEEVLRRSGWHDGFSREVVGRIDREYPGTYVQHAYGTADGNKRSARIGFYGEIDEGIQTILDNYSRANEVEIEVSTNLGFRRREMEEAVPLVYDFLMDSEGVAGGSGHSDWDRVSMVIELEPGVPESKADELEDQAQQLVYDTVGDDTGIIVDVVIGTPPRVIPE